MKSTTFALRRNVFKSYYTKLQADMQVTRRKMTNLSFCIRSASTQSALSCRAWTCHNPAQELLIAHKLPPPCHCEGACARGNLVQKLPTAYKSVPTRTVCRLRGRLGHAPTGVGTTDCVQICSPVPSAAYADGTPSRRALRPRNAPP